MKAWWSTIVAVLLVFGLCGMAMYVTGKGNACSTQIDWIGQCK